MPNPLEQLHAAGQSIWYDNIRRGLLLSGELARLAREDSVTGVTANPTIFEKAITGSTDYDDAIDDFGKQGLSANDVYERLVTADVRSAADILRPIYERSSGADGFVSLEVSPELAFDTAGTIQEAKRFWAIVDRPNVMIKVPGTPAGVPAVEELIAAGLNINITLLFSVAAHEQVMEAYLRGLERRVQASQPIDRIASVASFFVSRIDTAVDKLLEAKLKENGDPGAQSGLRRLLGKAAIANAKIAYDRFQAAFSGDRFAALKARGARVQRPLWASTSTKNPAYRDVMYVEALIGPDTVDTMPPQTIVAFRDHGKVERTVDRDLAGAHAVIDDLRKVGVDIDAITAQVLDEGVKSFSASFTELAAGLSEKLGALSANATDRQHFRLFDEEQAFQDEFQRLRQTEFVRRIWGHDPAAWTDDETVAKSIKNRLGWLDVSSHMIEQLPVINGVAESVRQAGFEHVQLLGMGGSSLCPEVFLSTFVPRAGYPRLHVLDSTDPRALRMSIQESDPAKTVYVVSSKSGTTTEPNDFFRYFWAKTEAVKGNRAGEQFIAITDPGTPLDALARERGFRHIFLNPPDIGGRYSALSYFGVAPAALMGIDVSALLSRAQRMEQNCAPAAPIEHNAGVELGAALGSLAKAGKNKITFICSPPIGSLGLWLEQLLAESTGKEGKGLIPVAGEPLGTPADYGNDRLFVYLRLAGEADPAQDQRMQALDAAGQPQVRITLIDTLDLGQEFFRWEMATATAGSVLGINPFDEPNVQESKDNTVGLLRDFEAHRKLPQPRPRLQCRGVAVSSNGDLTLAGDGDALTQALRAFLGSIAAGDYVALMAYIAPTKEHQRMLDRIRITIRDGLKVATTVGFGPRFLHSTGQLHKGGPNTGVFLQLTGIDGPDLAIPGEPYSFQTLIDAQALGDLRALEQHGRRVLRLDLRNDVATGLATIELAAAEALH